MTSELWHLPSDPPKDGFAVANIRSRITDHWSLITALAASSVL
jgi:hypothetical protein